MARVSADHPRLLPRTSTGRRQREGCRGGCRQASKDARRVVTIPLTGGLLSRLAVAQKPAARRSPGHRRGCAADRFKTSECLRGTSRPRSKRLASHQGNSRHRYKDASAVNATRWGLVQRSGGPCRSTPRLAAAPGTTAPASQSPRRMRLPPPVRARRIRPGPEISDARSRAHGARPCRRTSLSAFPRRPGMDAGRAI
jgi:hypothetical protein